MSTSSDEEDGSTGYVLGHSERELERLRVQAQLIDPITLGFCATVVSVRACAFWTWVAVRAQSRF